MSSLMRHSIILGALREKKTNEKSTNKAGMPKGYSLRVKQEVNLLWKKGQQSNLNVSTLFIGQKEGKITSDQDLNHTPILS